jgi:outer membrane protein
VNSSQSARGHHHRIKAWIGLLATLLCISALSARAEQWTLKQCLERALESSPDVHAALADEQIAISQLGRAKAGRLPQATFTGLLSAITAAEGNAVDGDTDNDDFGPYSTGRLEIVQPLYTFGRLRNEIRAAMQGVASKEAATEQARQAVIVAIKELHANLLLSRQIKELLDESHDNFTTAINQVEERLEAGEGNVTEQDLLRLRIGQSSIAKERYTLERAIAVARAALKRHLGLPADASFELAETRLQPVTLNLQPLSNYLEQMGPERPELAQLEAGLAARQARLEAARSDYYPSIFLAGGFEYSVAPNRDDQDSPFARDFNFFRGPGIALGLRWQLDFWSTQAKVAERTAELNKVQVQKISATSGIALDIRRRYLEVEEFRNKVKAAQEARKAARALLVTTLANFQLGVGEAKEVFEGLGLYTRIVSDYYQTIRDFNIAAAKLTQATGQEITTLSDKQ